MAFYIIILDFMDYIITNYLLKNSLLEAFYLNSSFKNFYLNYFLNFSVMNNFLFLEDIGKPIIEASGCK